MKKRLLILIALSFALTCGGNSDSDVQKAIQGKLAEKNISGVTVTVKDGVATLEGETEEITVKNMAEASALTVDGVRSVVNNITVTTRHSGEPSADDERLKAKIEEDLKRAGCIGVTVTVANSKVTIEGIVPNDKYVECLQVVNLSGASGIERNLLQSAK